MPSWGMKIAREQGVVREALHRYGEGRRGCPWKTTQTSPGSEQPKLAVGTVADPARAPRQAANRQSVPLARRPILLCAVVALTAWV